jgi:hypothetical protein
MRTRACTNFAQQLRRNSLDTAISHARSTFLRPRILYPLARYHKLFDYLDWYILLVINLADMIKYAILHGRFITQLGIARRLRFFLRELHPILLSLCSSLILNTYIA